MRKSLKNVKVSVLSFSGAPSKQMMTYVKPTIEEKPDFILYTGTNEFRSNAKPEEIANCRCSCLLQAEVVFSAILLGLDKLNEKGTVVNEKTKKLFTCLRRKILLLLLRKIFTS